MGTTGGRLLAEERRKRIVGMVDERQSVLVSSICEEFGVSAVTARGDLDYLEQEGLLKRTHGGAVAVTQNVIPRVSERLRKNASAKRLIARLAAERVHDGEMILVGSGSTTLEFVMALDKKRDLTIVTNACHVIDYAEAYLPDVTIMSTGGKLERKYRHYCGPLVVASLRDVYAEEVFLGADGFEPSFGFLAEYEQTAIAKVEFLRHARTRTILMDESKVGAGRSFVRFAKPDGVDVVIMDADPDGLVASVAKKVVTAE